MRLALRERKLAARVSNGGKSQQYDDRRPSSNDEMSF
jgi:hypothetical protein